MEVEAEKRRAAEAAARLVEAGMTVGLGTGSTVAYLLPALAARRLELRCVATSARTEMEGVALGLRVEPFSALDSLDRLDLAIDGADQVDTAGWLLKGGGGAQVREKIVAAASDRFVVIVSSDKQVARIAAPVPLELLSFGLAATLRELGAARVRPGAAPSPDGGVIADWMDPFDDPVALSVYLDAVPGVVGHGLFPPTMVSGVIVGGPE